MSETKPYFIPHPLCSDDPKILEDQLNKQGIESLYKYIKGCDNPLWAASHLIRVIGKGVGTTNDKLSTELYDLAAKLASSSAQDKGTSS